MNWSLQLIEPSLFVRITAYGDFTLEDCFGIKEDFLSQEYWKPGMNILIDYRESIFSNMNLDILRKAGAFHETHDKRIGNGRMAFLMKSPHDFGLARQYEMITEGKVLSHIHIFQDENAALEWLSASSMNA